MRRRRCGTANGWPIATGVIEGACRHLVKDVDAAARRSRVDGNSACGSAASRFTSQTVWTSPEPAGDYQAPRPSSSSEHYTATATSTPTGATTSKKNADASTKPATSTQSSHMQRDHSEESHTRYAIRRLTLWGHLNLYPSTQRG